MTASAGVTRPFPWDEALSLGLHGLRLSPDLFWSLTPRELMIMAEATGRSGAALDRAGLKALMARYGE
jgi:uncharacterized phage protein (TIGR02216 family)